MGFGQSAKNKALWRLTPEVLSDPEGQAVLTKAMTEYMINNWGSSQSHTIEWEAMKSVLRGQCLGLPVE